MVEHPSVYIGNPFKGNKAADERTPEPESGQQFGRSDCRSAGDSSGPGSRISRWPQSLGAAGVVEYASPVLLGRTNEVEVVEPVQPELNGSLTKENTPPRIAG
jgi:hypothetical protein